MSPPIRVGAKQRYQPFNAIPPSQSGTRNSGGPRAPAKLRLGDSYLASEADNLTGLANIKRAVARPNPRKDSLNWFAVEGSLIAAGTLLLATQWDREGVRALGGWMVGAGLTGVTLEIFEDTRVTVKLPAWYKIGASTFMGLTGSMTVLTLGGFKAGIYNNDVEYPVDEYGERKGHVPTESADPANSVSN